MFKNIKSRFNYNNYSIGKFVPYFLIFILLLLFLGLYINQKPSSINESKNNSINGLVSVESYAALANDGKDDTKEIQNAINDSEKSGGGTIFLPSGVYDISKTIVIKKNITLQLSNGTVLRMVKNLNVVQLKPTGQLIGGTINTQAVYNFTKSAIYLDGKDKFTVKKPSIVENVNLIGKKQQGSGITLYSGDKNSFIQWTKFSNINLVGYKKGIHLKVDFANGNWINGNNFLQVSISHCNYGIYIDGGSKVPSEVSGNIFSLIQFNCTTETRNAFYISGSSNYISGNVWDVHYLKSDIAIKFSSNSKFNTVDINSNKNFEQYQDDGLKNVLK